jgi:uroporphyrinogen decarboxylase
MSDPYAEGEAFGMKVVYPLNNLPRPESGVLLKNFEDVENLSLPEISACRRMAERVKEVETFRKRVGGKYLVTGWVEGPIAAYSLVRGLSSACMDFFDYPEEMIRVLRMFTDNACNFIKLQIEAGADCIGVGDAAASQIGPELYRKYIFPLEKELVDLIHERGALAKVHICGDTSSIQKMMIEAGFDIVDVDHNVGSVEDYVSSLSPHQKFAGYCDPVEDVLFMEDYISIYSRIKSDFDTAEGKLIISAGCEIPGEIPVDKFRTFCRAARAVRN